MSTDPREFEHPIDGTDGNVPPLVDVIAGVLADTPYESLEDCARAVLAAISEAGTVEWGVQYERLGLESAETSILKSENKSHADSTAALGMPSIGWNHRVVSRITGPWTAVEG